MAGREPISSLNSNITVQIISAKDLIVYKKDCELMMEMFHANRIFPKDEKYALVDQIRRWSRNVCLNLRECWAKRRYEAHFMSKLTDAERENDKTETRLEFAQDCGCLLKRDHARFTFRSHEIGAMLGSMINNPSSFIFKSAKSGL